jgi:PIN domain nuclease of toxin-antitoxin system
MAAGDCRLGEKAHDTIEADQDRWLSTMVYWELAMLVWRGRLALNLPLRHWVDACKRLMSLKEAAVTADIALDAGGLGEGIHGDPGDRIIIATARAMGCVMATSDRKILAYAEAGHLQAIDARR